MERQPFSNLKPMSQFNNIWNKALKFILRALCLQNTEQSSKFDIICLELHRGHLKSHQAIILDSVYLRRTYGMVRMKKKNP